MPDISIVMACFNAQDFLADAVESALRQTGVTLEVIIVDDHSTDSSFELANTLAREDTRVRVFQTPENSGPGGARNVGIANMRGRWYAVLDCDDALEPGRSQKLIDLAEANNADMICDDLLVFGDGLTEHHHLGEKFAVSPPLITLDHYFANTCMFAEAPNLGFLKPLIRRDIIERFGIRYRTDLRIGEDDELVIRLLLAGAKYIYAPEALYRYRKHAASISHRLSASHSDLMVRSETEIRATIVAGGMNSAAYEARYASILDAAAFSRSIEALKTRDIGTAVSAVAKRPSALRHYAMPISARWKRLIGAS